jgi:hypothetical protein
MQSIAPSLASYLFDAEPFDVNHHCSEIAGAAPAEKASGCSNEHEGSSTHRTLAWTRRLSMGMVDKWVINTPSCTGYLEFLWVIMLPGQPGRRQRRGEPFITRAPLNELVLIHRKA